MLFSILIGGLAGCASFIILITFFFQVGLFGWSDGGEKDYLDKLERSTTITAIVSIVIAITVFFYVIYSMLNRYSKKSSSSIDNLSPPA